MVIKMKNLELRLVERLIDNNGVTRNIYKIGHYNIIEVMESVKRVLVTIDFEVSEYVPEIYYVRDWNEQMGEFKLQTTSFGALTIDEFEKFMTAQQEAIEIAKILKNKFC